MPTLPPLTQRLRGDGLDGVVAVVGGRQVEEVEGAARAAGAAHLHAHDGEAEQRADERARPRSRWPARADRWDAPLPRERVDRRTGAGRAGAATW